MKKAHRAVNPAAAAVAPTVSLCDDNGRRHRGCDDEVAAKLAQSFPDITCVGWNCNAAIDPDRIRSKIDE